MGERYHRFEAQGGACDAFTHFTIEALMLMAPWSLHTTEGCEIKERIAPIMEQAVERYPNHPGLCHLHAHFQELGPTPEVARGSALALAGGIGGAHNGHLFHMGGHILAQLGEHDASMKSNRMAREADLICMSERTDTGLHGHFIPISTLHNLTFVIWGAMESGQKAIAIAAAQELRQSAERMAAKLEKMKKMPFGQPYYDLIYMMFVSYQYHSYIRFGLWNMILSLPLPPRSHDLHHAMARFSRGVAFAATERVIEAEQEYEAFKAAVPQSNFEERRYAVIWGLTFDVLKVEMAWLEGEIEYRKGKYDEAFELLRTAVQLEDSLPYCEAPAFPIPPRHALAALLMEQRRFAEAQPLYEHLLQQGANPKGRCPNSIWALAGLRVCMEEQGRVGVDVDEIEVKLAAAREIADFEVKTSCACAVERFGTEVVERSPSFARSGRRRCC